MTVYARPNGRWAVQVYDPRVRRMRQVGTFQTRKQAKRAETEAMNVSGHTGRETLESFHARWERDYPRPKASTNKHNVERTQGFAREYARRRLDSITADEARRWGLAHRGTVPALRAMFNDARRSGLVVGNPFAELGISRGRGRRDLASEWLTAEGIEALEDSARRCHGDYGETMASIIRFAAETGIRPGELFALRREDLRGETCEIKSAADSSTRTVTKPKNGRGRTIVLTAAARKAAERAIRFEGVDLVFVSPRGRQFWQSSFSYVSNPVRKAADRPTMHFYELRHYCATRLLELGLTPADVAVQLGHTDNGALVMSTYGHPSDRAARGRILQAMDGLETGELAEIRRRRGA
jgi:integrase